ncbi:MAG: NAD(P)H-dependent oxidoreductase [Candidatus Kaiserbacteria bacterium]|nr:NAD(P)H-dependent oxidoreductase [Candidatus Kaiserbacteria bacterium]
MHWRAAVKSYDTSKKLSPEQLDMLLESVRLAPSSAGLQPYIMFVVDKPEIRQKLRAAGYNQAQITDASHFFVFAVPTNLTESLAAHYIDVVAQVRDVPRDTLGGLEAMVTGAITSKPVETRAEWATRQAYLALGVLITAAAVEGIDCSPMEGFDPAQFDEILGLKELNMKSVVMVAAGFRAEDDAYSTLTKVRYPREELIVIV